MRKTIYFVLVSLFIAVSLFVSLLVLPQKVHAVDGFEAAYNFDYYINQGSNSIDITLQIQIKNLRPDIYVDQFSISFPKSFNIENLRATDGVNPILFKQENFTAMTRVTFTFEEPSIPQAENNITLNYSINNVFNQKGNVAEMILPLIVKKDQTKVSATVHLPENFDRTLTVAKPVPTKVEFNSVRWENIEHEALYLLFGEAQQYQTTLKYHLDNPGFTNVEKFIVLPPETLYQKVYLESLDPLPNYTSIDEDGNYLAHYTVPPHGSTDIVFKGIIEARIKPQEDLKIHVQEKFLNQKKYLLSEKKFWSLGKYLDTDPIKSITNVQDIYTYVTDLLSYSSTVDSTTQRRGASKAIEEPFRAVCTEYTDLFIAIAREKGYYTREIQGYAYTEDRKIRPLLSSSTDVLHSWVEYFDQARLIWVPIDPTWGDTSKVDYLHAFDVNHIALAIHGKDSVLPYPAGFYKKNDSKDISVSIAKSAPKVETNISIEADYPSEIYRGSGFSEVQIKVTNNGNTFINDLNIQIEADQLTFDKAALEVGQIAPYQTKELTLSISAKDSALDDDIISFSYNGETLKQLQVQINSRAQNLLQNLLGVIVGIIILLGGLKILLKRQHGHKH